ncbi:hypothetical protein ABZS66_34190 [Dactylosporangium sp. NPDC005572]|uniref:hypothetical protein n=1 Tax=Dactylosporangium sp. NPDC005572 TaxID=3156889 RepID=UPI0033A29BF9
MQSSGAQRCEQDVDSVGAAGVQLGVEGVALASGRGDDLACERLSGPDEVFDGFGSVAGV